jgi:hypothetical protein
MLQVAGNLSCCGALPHHRFPALTERPGASGSPLRQAIERPLPAIGLSPQTGPQGCRGWRTTACNGHMQGIGRPQRSAPAAQTGVGMAVLRLQFHQQKARREAQVLSDQTERARTREPGLLPKRTRESGAHPFVLQQRDWPALSKPHRRPGRPTGGPKDTPTRSSRQRVG